MSGCVQSYIANGNIKFTQAQLEGLWCQAGGPQQSMQIASAVAMAESGGNSTNTCVDSDSSVDRGLWQINSSNGNWSTYDVMTNARGAVAISNKGTDWRPWTTFTSGAYLQFMQGIPPADTSAPINPTQAAANQPQSATDTSILCNEVTQIINPGLCIGSSFFGSIEQKAIDYTILQILRAVINPFLSLFGGIIGVAAGSVMIILGINYLVTGSLGGGIKGAATMQTSTREEGSLMQEMGWFAGPEVGAPATAATRVPAVPGRTGGSGGMATAARQTQRQSVTTRDSLRLEAGQYRRGSRPK